MFVADVFTNPPKRSLPYWRQRPATFCSAGRRQDLTWFVRAFPVIWALVVLASVGIGVRLSGCRWRPFSRKREQGTRNRPPMRADRGWVNLGLCALLRLVLNLDAQSLGVIACGISVSRDVLTVLVPRALPQSQNRFLNVDRKRMRRSRGLNYRSTSLRLALGFARHVGTNAHAEAVEL